MPLMVFMGEKGRTRRTPEAIANRQVKQAKRGFTQARIKNIKRGEDWSGYQTREEEPWTDGTWGRSSSSNQAANDRTAWQDERGWNTGWRSKNNWGWKQ